MDPALLTTRTRLAQGGCAAALFGLAGVVFWARSPQLVEVPPDKPVLPEVVEGGPQGSEVRPSVDMQGLGIRLAKIDNRPRPVEVEPVEPAPAPSAPASNIAFHGVARIGARTMALVNVAGKQRFVGVGQSLDGGTVREITPEELVLGPDPERRIPLSERSGGAVTKTTGSATSSVPGAMPGMKPTGMGRRGMFTVPSSIPAVEANAWRMLRAQVEADPQYAPFDANARDETATKLLESQRYTLRQNGMIPTRSEVSETGGKP